MVAERERRAAIARSEGDMESRINRSRGVMEEAINRSEGEKQRRINEAEGMREEILALARASSVGLRNVAQAIESASGEEALVLRLAEQYLEQMRKLARSETQVVLPMDMSDLSRMMDHIRSILKSGPL